MSLVFTNQNQPTGFTFTKGGFPMKAPTMSQGSYLSNSLVQYKNKAGNPSKPAPFTQYTVNLSTSSSQITERKKILAIGKNTNRIGIKNNLPSGFTNNDSSYVKTKQQRCRSGGCVAPAKKGASLISTSAKIPANRGFKLP